MMDNMMYATHVALSVPHIPSMPDGQYPLPQRLALPQGPTSSSSSSISRPQSAARRTKANVACRNCKKAHLSCGKERPCARCVASDKTAGCFHHLYQCSIADCSPQATCIDAEHKKRGRPRLRKDQTSGQAAAVTVAQSSETARG